MNGNYEDKKNGLAIARPLILFQLNDYFKIGSASYNVALGTFALFLSNSD